MNTIPFVKLWPGGNTTALVTEKFARNQHVFIARKILSADKIIEQVGFLENPENPKAAVRLQMMGGEFCGNATRATAYFWAMKTRLKSFKIEVSGFPEILTAKVIDEQVEIELPGNFFQKIENKKVQIIDLMGIRFILQQFPKNRSKAKKLIKKYRENCPAVGVLYVLFYDRNIVIDPMVWVRETNTYYDETACGSGSIAVSIVSFIENPRKKTFSVVQPSGEIYTIQIKAQKNKITNIKFKGIVKLEGQESITLLL